MNAGDMCLSAITSRVRIGWKKLKKLSGVLCGEKWPVRLFRKCVRTTMVYGSETWVIKKAELKVLRRADRDLVRMMSGMRLRQEEQ